MLENGCSLQFGKASTEARIDAKIDAGSNARIDTSTNARIDERIDTKIDARFDERLLNHTTLANLRWWLESWCWQRYRTSGHWTVDNG